MGMDQRKAMHQQTTTHSRQRGMTLIELVAVIVISGIMATGVVTYIVRSAQGVNSSASRNQLASTGRIAVDRLAMELHNALPNSIRRINSGGRECLEFIPVRASTSYIDPPFTGSGGTTFDVVDFLPTLHGVTDGYAVIYPSDRDQLYAGDIGTSSGWPNFADRGPIQTITNIADSASDDQSTITLAKTHRFNRRSPASRFFVVDDPISYCLSGSNLYRYTNYGFFTSQVTVEESLSCQVASDQRCLPNYAAAPDKTLITNSINSAASSFSVGSQTLTRNALVSIELTFTSNGDSVSLSHEILTRSVP